MKTICLASSLIELLFARNRKNTVLDCLPDSHRKGASKRLPSVNAGSLFTCCLFGLLAYSYPQAAQATPLLQSPSQQQTPDPYFSRTAIDHSAKPNPQASLNRTTSWDAPITPVKADSSKTSFALPTAMESDLIKPVFPSKPTIIREPNLSPDTGLAPLKITGISGNTSPVDSFPNPSDLFGRQPDLSDFRFDQRSESGSFEPRISPPDDISIPHSKPPQFGMLDPLETPPAASSTQPSFASFEPGKVVALVGGEPIFVGDMMFEINQFIEQAIPGAPQHIKELRRKEMIPQILPKFIEAKILFLGGMQSLPEGVDLETVFEQAAKEFDDKALAKMIEESGVKSRIEFDAHLRAQGSSLRQLRRSWSQQQLTQFFLGQKLSEESEVTHQEMLDNYHENLASYAMPAKCRWEQIMIHFDKYPTRKAAMDAVVELGNRIVYGANFAAVAKESSDGFRADSGGNHDWTTKNALVSKEIDEAIFSLPIGVLSDIIESSNGYHIIRVIERTEAKNKPFLEAQVDIKQSIQLEKRKKAFDDYLSKLKDEIPVEYLINDDISPPTSDELLTDRQSQ